MQNALWVPSQGNVDGLFIYTILSLCKKRPSHIGPNEMGQVGWLGLLVPTMLDLFFLLIF